MGTGHSFRFFCISLLHDDTQNRFSCLHFRQLKNPLRIPRNYQNGTTMDQAQGKLQEKTVKSFYSKWGLQQMRSLYVEKIFYCYIADISLSVHSPQAIFKDPFRGGTNILVHPIPTDSYHSTHAFSLLFYST